MATKPTNAATWNTGGANRVDPGTTKRALGWEVGEQPPSSYFNHWMNLAGQWTDYLKDGALTGNHTITGTLAVSGALSAQSTLAVTSNGTVGGTLGVTGLITATAGLTASGAITANGGASVPSGQTLDVDGVVDFGGATVLRLPARTLNLPASSGHQGAGTVAYGDGGAATASANASSWHMPIALHAGDRITSITVYYSRDSGGTLTFELRELTPGSGAAALVAKNVSSGTGSGNTSIGSSPTSGSLPQTLVAGRFYYLRLTLDNGDDIYGASVVYDRPMP